MGGTLFLCPLGDLGSDVPYGPSLRIHRRNLLPFVGATHKGSPFPGMVVWFHSFSPYGKHCVIWYNSSVIKIGIGLEVPKT